MAKGRFRNLFRGAKHGGRHPGLEQTTRPARGETEQQQLFAEPAPIAEAERSAVASQPAPSVAELPQPVVAAEPAPAADLPASNDSAAAAERNVGEYVSESLQLRDSGRFEDAEALLVEAIERFPTEPRPRVEWAVLAHARRDWPEAVRHWELVRAEFSNEPAAYALGAIGLRELGGYDEAEKLLSAGRERFPGDFGIANEGAWLATHRRDWAEALRRWGRMRKQFPERPAGYTGMAMIQRELRWFDEVDAMLTDAVERFPAEPTPWIDHARLVEARGDWAEAAVRWEAVRERFPDHPGGYASGANAYRELGRLDEAEALLGEAVQRLPNNTGLAIGHVAAAHQRRDWVETVRRCETLRTAFPLEPIGYTLAGAAMRELGRFDEAEPLLSSACARFRADIGTATEYAHLAVARRDWARAAERWEEVCRRDPDQLGAQLQRAVALREIGRHDDAEALLGQSAAKHPESPHPLIELARVAEARQDWEEALARWRHLRSRHPDESVSYIGEAAALRRLGRAEEAEPVLLKAAERLPHDPAPLADWALIAHHRRDWEEALKRWDSVHANFPDHANAYLFGAAALRELGRLDEAEALLADAFGRFPDHSGFSIERAHLAERRQDWPEAERWWRAALAASSNTWWVHLSLARVLREQGNATDAEAVLANAQSLFPAQPEFFAEWARVAEARKHWPEAERRWAVMREKFPSRSVGYMGLAMALREQGESEAAEAVLLEATERFPDEGWFQHEKARLDERREDWAAAERSWRASLDIPSAPWWAYAALARVLVRQGHTEDAERALSSGLGAFPNESSLQVELARLTETHGNILSLSQLAAKFESLGGGGLNQDAWAFGCEFGFFQRHARIEPLGLLRWASIGTEDLIRALDAEFAGIDDPAALELRPYSGTDWGALQTTYRIRWDHSNLERSIVSEEDARKSICRNLNFLKRKLLEDLTSGEKIFVYRVYDHTLPRETLTKLSASLNRYAANTLLYVTRSTEEHPAFTVEELEQGLLIGYIDRFAPNSAGLGHNHESWEAVCRAALARLRGPEFGADGLRQSGRGEEADALLRRRVERFPDAPEPLIDFARAAEARDEWEEALTRWREARTRFPEEAAAYLGEAAALRRLGRADEAEPLLLRAAELLHDPDPLVEWALTAHHRRDWPEASKRWDAVRANFPDSGNAYSLGAAALRELGRLDEAEDLLRDAFERFPPDFSLFVERSRIAEMRGDMTEAQQRWAALKAAFPQHSLGYTAEARALRHLGLMDAAEALLANALDLFPDDKGVGSEYAWLAQISRDWEGAAKRWEQLRTRHPDLPVGYSGGAGALRELKRFDEAEALLAEANGRFPREPSVIIETARLAHIRGDWPTAAAYWANVRSLLPNEVEGYAAGGLALAEQGCFDQADEVLKEGLERIPGSQRLYAVFAEIATKCNNWREAFSRWTEAQKRFPEARDFSARLFEARLRLYEVDPEGIAALDDSPAEGSGAANMRDVLMAFESLGHGCEFGGVQRAFGSEPLGLLRWGAISPQDLIAALDAGFAGVGAPENTELTLRPNGAQSEYWVADRRFGMEMHTFIGAEQISFERMFEQSCRRMKFLSRKLLDDLQRAEKIFVYKLNHRDLTDEEIFGLHAGLRRYGDATLLCVRRENEQKQNGTVDILGPGLMLAYIDRFAEPQANGRLTVSVDSWSGICRTAYQLWKSGAVAFATEQALETVGRLEGATA